MGLSIPYTAAIRTLADTPLPELPALLVPALGETLAMVGIVMLIVIVLGTPIAVALHNMAPGGLFEHSGIYTVLSWIVNIGRSLPFLVLMAAIVPFTRFVTGTNIGVAAAVVPMTLAGIPFFARLVENCLRDVPRSVTAAARACGGSRLQVIRSAQLGEAVPAILGGLTINTIAMIEYSAIAGTIGAGGIGYVAVTYGYQRFDQTVMLATVLLLIAMVTVVQLTGDAQVRTTTPHLRRRA